MKRKLQEYVFIAYKYLKSLASYIITTLILFTLYIILNFLINMHFQEEGLHQRILLLNSYTEEIKRLILNDFKKIFQQKGHKADDLSVITNFVYAPNNESKYPDNKLYLSNNTIYIKQENQYLIIDLSNIQKILDEIAKELFFYSISINESEILTNKLTGLTKSGLSASYQVAKDVNLNIKLQHSDYSPFIIANAQGVKSNITKANYISLIIFISLWIILCLYIKQAKTLSLTKKAQENIISFIHTNKEFIIQCYEYSKNIHDVTSDKTGSSTRNNYLPIPVVYKEATFKEVEILVDKVAEQINGYFAYYPAYTGVNNLKLNIIFPKHTLITIPFDYEIFYQILISILYNFMNLNKKSKDTRTIEVNFTQKQIVISSEGLKLNQEFAIKASETIFYDSINPYIMSFGQTFVLLGMYNIKYEIFYKEDGTTITISLPNTNKSNSNNHEVINLHQYNKRSKK